MKKQITSLGLLAAFAVGSTFAGTLMPGETYGFEDLTIGNLVTTEDEPISTLGRSMTGTVKAGNGGKVVEFTSVETQGTVIMNLEVPQVAGKFSFDFAPVDAGGKLNFSRISIYDSANNEIVRISLRNTGDARYLEGDEDGKKDDAKTTMTNVFSMSGFSRFTISVDTNTDTFGLDIAGIAVEGVKFRSDANATDIGSIRFRTIGTNDVVQIDNVTFKAE